MEDKAYYVHIHAEEAFDRDNELSDICLECGEHFIKCICENESFTDTTYRSLVRTAVPMMTCLFKDNARG